MPNFSFRGVCARWFTWFAILAGVGLFLSAGQANAAAIVVLGASNASGYGVGAGQAWPARLEQMLHAKGYDVSITVLARPGATSAETLSHVDSAVPSGTRVVIFDAYHFNDGRNGLSPAQTQANIAQIKSRIQARGAVPILGSIVLPTQYRQPDGIHWTAEGHAQIAARLLPQVAAAMGKH
jgi:acyl-CoA thioesterase-1